MFGPFLLAGLSVIPLVPVFFWFKIKKYGRLQFFLAAGAGLVSLLAAGLAQRLFPPGLPNRNEFADILFSVFVRVSLVEEAARAAVLWLLFIFCPYSRILFSGRQERDVHDRKASFFGAPSGLAAGLGFAAAESVFYGLVDFRVALLRLITAAPLHAACGIRIGNALGIAKKQRIYALFLFVTAFIIHSMYNLCILNPEVPWFLSVFIALAALGSSLISLRFEVVY